MFVKGNTYFATDVDNKVDFKAVYHLMRIHGGKAFFKVIPLVLCAKETTILADVKSGSAIYHGIKIDSSLEAVI